MTRSFMVLAQKAAKRLQHIQKFSGLISLKPEGLVKGRVLLGFELEPFVNLKKGEPLAPEHTRFWEFVEIANIHLAMGYIVDVFDWRNQLFKPQKPYDIYLDTRFNLEHLAPLLNPECIRVYYGQTANIYFHNVAEARRLLELQQRRGISLRPNRYETPTRSLEHADCAAILGNDFTFGTYAYAGKPMHRLYNSCLALHDWPAGKDFSACRRNFLWLASGGMVHKGLDRALEAFAAMPDYQLTVCGPVSAEPDFEQAYFQLLHHTPNIDLVGWVDVGSEAFRSIADRCVALVYPSCSEGQAGAVISAMHAGLIPIMSYESGVNAGDFGTILRTCSIEEIQQAVQAIATASPTQLRERAQATWTYARTYHTRESFSRSYRAFAEQLEQTYKTNREHPSASPTVTSQDVQLVQQGANF